MKTVIATLALLLAALFPPFAHAQLILPNGCSEGSADACAYVAAPAYAVGVVDFELLDAARNNHPVPIRVRYPRGATGARPVVIWSHGGAVTEWRPTPNANGVQITDGQTSSERRSESFARAGYIVIHIGRLPPVTLTPQHLDICLRSGVLTTSPEGCKAFVGWHVYGPQNVAFVAAILPQYQVGMLPGFTGTLDYNRIVIGGWSGGTESPQNIAGAWQQWLLDPPGGVQPYRLDAVSVPGVVAFFADSPRSPAWGGFTSGFQEDSLYAIDERPFLFNTGKADIGGDTGPEVARTSAFLSAAKGGKYLAWSPTLTQGGPIHATMDLGTDGCQTALQQVHCNALESLGVAFLDAVVERKPLAIAWMASDALRVLSRQAIELHRR